jgi:hypothetical protein
MRSKIIHGRATLQKLVPMHDESATMHQYLLSINNGPAMLLKPFTKLLQQRR